MKRVDTRRLGACTTANTEKHLYTGPAVTYWSPLQDTKKMLTGCIMTTTAGVPDSAASRQNGCFRRYCRFLGPLPSTINLPALPVSSSSFLLRLALDLCYSFKSFENLRNSPGFLLPSVCRSTLAPESSATQSDRYVLSFTTTSHILISLQDRCLT